MESRIARWKAGRDATPLSDCLEAGLVDWFISHVSTMDYITARFIKAQGKG
jgi:hemerythrin